MRRALAGTMFLAVALSAESAFAAWQTDESALLGVGIIALLAIAAAIHLRVGLIHERSLKETERTAAAGARANLQAELKAAGVHVLTIRHDRDQEDAALSDLLTAADSARLTAALGGLTAHGEALVMQCAGRADGETFDVSGFASAAGEITLNLARSFPRREPTRRIGRGNRPSAYDA